ncbi:MAG: type II toxin-antitoxin system HicA family toxin [Casimicrobiaceae bacterium]
MTRGSHLQFEHRTEIAHVTVPGEPSDELTADTVNSMLRRTRFEKRGQPCAWPS